MSLWQDLVGEPRALASLASLEEALDSFFAILLHVPFDVTLGNAERPHDIDLFATTLADELRRDHPKRLRIVFGMLSDRLNATEVEPHAFLLDGAKTFIDAGGTIGDQWQ